jgi:hypothetical protein
MCNYFGQSSSNFEFLELILRLIGGGLVPYSQTVGFLLRFPLPTSEAEKWISPWKNGLDQIPISCHFILPHYVGSSSNYEFLELIFILLRVV